MASILLCYEDFLWHFSSWVAVCLMEMRCVSVISFKAGVNELCFIVTGSYKHKSKRNCLHFSV